MILALPARAKLNLALAVTGIRPDHTHEIDTLLQGIDLHDLLEAELATATSLEVEGDAPEGPDNLVLRALAELERQVGRALPTRFRLHKRVPAGAGLGGGSADAATALRLAAAVHRLAEVDLAAVAAAVGADVPFLLCGGAA
ncbi:MAG: 4-(cytidine 5'-diphospho)-2-C-methyl-D-erythritol kinase, partial [Chloroflexota bacterium]